MGSGKLCKTVVSKHSLFLNNYILFYLLFTQPYNFFAIGHAIFL